MKPFIHRGKKFRRNGADFWGNPNFEFFYRLGKGHEWHQVKPIEIRKELAHKIGNPWH